MLSTRSARELATAALLVAVSGIAYTLQAVWPAKAADPAIDVAIDALSPNIVLDE